MPTWEASMTRRIDFEKNFLMGMFNSFSAKFRVLSFVHPLHAVEFLFHTS